MKQLVHYFLLELSTATGHFFKLVCSLKQGYVSFTYIYNKVTLSIVAIL